MNEILWDLTALCSDRANGWNRQDLDKVIFQLGHYNPKEVRSILTNLGHIELFNENRYRVLGPYLVRTIEDELVLCGARSEKTVDWIEQNTGLAPKIETMSCGLDRITLSEDSADSIKDVVGIVPVMKLGPTLLDDVTNQADWVNELLWDDGSGMNPYRPSPQSVVKVFDLGKLNFQTHESTSAGGGYAQNARHYPMALFIIPDQQIQDKGILTRPPTRDMSRQEAVLQTLGDLRRARYYACEVNDRFLFCRGTQNSLMIPRFMPPPPDLELSLYMMHCRQPKSIDVPTDDSQNSEYSSFSNFSQDLAKKVVEKLWTGGAS